MNKIVISADIYNGFIAWQDYDPIPGSLGGETWDSELEEDDFMWHVRNNLISGDECLWSIVSKKHLKEIDNKFGVQYR